MAGAPVLCFSALRPVPPHWTVQRECEGPGIPPPGPSARLGAGYGAHVQPPSGRQLRLAAHDQEVVITEVGGGLRLYRAAGVDVLDSYAEDEMCSGGRGQFLAPWPNRLGDGAFEWEGHSYQTALSEPSRHNAIHGLVRWANWTLPEPGSVRSPYTPQTPVDSVSVNYRLHAQPGWAWTLDFRITYRLTPEHGLEVRTTVTNLSDDPCPFGFGWHPYIRADVDECQLTLPASTAYTADDRGLPQGRVSVQGTDLDFRRPRSVGRAQLDTAFTDLDRDPYGRAVTVVTRGDGTRTALWVDQHYTHLMVYTGDTLSDPARRRRGLAIEPMTGAPNLLRTGDGLLVLGPKDHFEATWGLDPYRKSG
jgi:aldose 1-epimerase